MNLAIRTVENTTVQQVWPLVEPFIADALSKVEGSPFTTYTQQFAGYGGQNPTYATPNNLNPVLVNPFNPYTNTYTNLIAPPSNPFSLRDSDGEASSTQGEE